MAKGPGLSDPGLSWDEFFPHSQGVFLPLSDSLAASWLCIPLSSLFPFASTFDPAASLLPADFLEHCCELWEASWREKGPLSALHEEDP